MIGQSAREKGKKARLDGVPVEAAEDQPLMQQAEWRAGWVAQDKILAAKVNIETGLENRPKSRVDKGIYSE